ncbi:hypothetical protein DB346_00590 [Verrucomicrobia bacterium LW23]|nr:hypothetical protein DB346_00590 [Verrucomicrobia bacterium LW23]
MSQKHFDALIEQFGAAIGIADLPQDGDSCRLRFDDQVTVHIQYEPTDGWVEISADVAVVPEEKKAEFYEKLLSANLFWLGTEGCTLAVESVSGIVVLQTRERVTDLQFATFSSVVEQFVNTATRWQTALSGDVTPEKVDAAQDLAPDAIREAEPSTEALTPGTAIRV